MKNYFKPEELVYPECHQIWGDRSLMFMDNRIIACANLFRETVGQPVYVNNYAMGYTLSGLRPFNATIGATWSQHKFGRALDLKVLGWSSKAMFEVVMDNRNKFVLLGLTTIENPAKTVGKHQDWLHIDCRTSAVNGIRIVNP